MLEIFHKPWDQIVQRKTFIHVLSYACFFLENTAILSAKSQFIATVLGGVDVSVCMCVFCV